MLQGQAVTRCRLYDGCAYGTLKERALTSTSRRSTASFSWASALWTTAGTWVGILETIFSYRLLQPHSKRSVMILTPRG
jgi:hypothetical protein